MDDFSFESRFCCGYHCNNRLISLSNYRWNDYRRVGNQVYGTRFIAFKVPLKEVKYVAFFQWKIHAEIPFWSHEWFFILSLAGNERESQCTRRKTVSRSDCFDTIDIRNKAYACFLEHFFFHSDCIQNCWFHWCQNLDLLLTSQTHLNIIIPMWVSKYF